MRCVHGDVVNYPLVPVSIQFRGKCIEWRWRLIPTLGIRWFWGQIGQHLHNYFWETGRGNREAVTQTGDAVSGHAQTGLEETRVRVELKPSELDDFPLEQSRDEMLKNANDRVRTIDGQPLQPDHLLSYTHFSLIKDRLYRVTQDTKVKGNTTQLLVPKRD